MRSFRAWSHTSTAYNLLAELSGKRNVDEGLRKKTAKKKEKIVGSLAVHRQFTRGSTVRCYSYFCLSRSLYFLLPISASSLSVCLYSDCAVQCSEESRTSSRVQRANVDRKISVKGKRVGLPSGMFQ